MANKIQVKRGLVATIPVGDSGELLFTTDTKDLYVGDGTTNNKLQKDLGYTPVPNTRTVAGKPLSADVTLVKADVGLANVDNTSDASKPISTAVTTALAGKQNTLNGSGLVRMSGTTVSYDSTSYLGWPNVGVANGVDGLDAGGKIPAAQLPAIAITDTFPVANQAAMLALTAEVGDIAVRTDLNKSFILRVAGPTVLANWQELLTPTSGVTSVNTLTGAVTLTTTNIAEGTNLYYTEARVNANASMVANNAKVTNATHTGDVTGATALTIANNAVTNAKAAQVATATMKGRASAGTGNVEDLTVAQVRTLVVADAVIDGGVW